MSRFPDPAASRAVLIGFSRYNDKRALPEIRAVRANLSDLNAALTRASTGTLDPRHCAEVSKPTTTVSDVGDAIATAAGQATDLLLVYYAGHGLVDDMGRLHLAVPSTNPGRLKWTALPIESLREEIAASPAAARVLVLDCCFSGRAIAAMSDPENVVKGQIDIGGTYTLTSTTANALSHAPAGARNTAFTGAMLSAPNGREPLTLDELFRHVDRSLAAQGLPRPQRRAVNAAGDLALFKTSTVSGVSATGKRLHDQPVQVSAAADDAAEKPEQEPKRKPQQAKPKRKPWQAKAMLAVWALFAALAVYGTLRAISTPAMLNVGAQMRSAFYAERSSSIPILAGIAIILAIFPMFTPIVAGLLLRGMVPVAAGDTVRGAAFCAGFVAGGWAAFFATLGVNDILQHWMPLAPALIVSLIGIALLFWAALGWTSEAGYDLL